MLLETIVPQMPSLKFKSGDHFDELRKFSLKITKKDFWITDDEKVLEAFFNENKDTVTAWMTRGTADQKEKAKTIWQRVKPDVLNAEIRQELIDKAFDRAKPAIDTSLDAYRRGGRIVIPTAIAERLETLLTGSFYFQKELAKRRLEAYFREYPVVVSDEIEPEPGPAGPPAKVRPELVSNFDAIPRPDGVLLGWKKPSRNFDGVVIVRRKGRGTPVPGKDERVLGSPHEPSIASEFLDAEIAGSERYTYAIYSVLRGSLSEAQTKSSYRVPPGIADYEPPKVAGSHVRLSWTSPAMTERIHVFRTSKSDAAVGYTSDGLKPPDGAVPIALPVGSTAHCEDDAARAGNTYYYHLVVEYPDRIFSEGLPVAVTVTRATPVKDLEARPRAAGVQLSWKVPEHCEEVIVMRAEGGKTPTMHDGRKVAAHGMPDKDSPFTMEDTLDLTPGAEYTYAVYSVRDGLTSREPATVTSYRLFPPVRLDGCELTDDGVAVRWQPDSAGRHDDLAKIICLRSEKRLDEDRIAIGQRAAPVDAVRFEAPPDSPWHDRTYVLGKEHHYHLLGLRKDGRYTAPAVTSLELPPPLEPPGGKKPRAEDGQIVVEWTAGSADATGYDLYRSDTPTPEELGEPIARLEGSRFADKEIVPGQTFYYHVAAVAVGRRSKTVCLGKVTAIAEVSELEASPMPGAVKVRWIASEHADAVEIQRAMTRGIWDAPRRVEAGAGRWLDEDAPPGKTARYRIRSCFGDIATPGRESEPVDVPPELADLPAADEPPAADFPAFEVERVNTEVRARWQPPDNWVAVLAHVVETGERQVIPAGHGELRLAVPAEESICLELRSVDATGAVSEALLRELSAAEAATD